MIWFLLTGVALGAAAHYSYFNAMRQKDADVFNRERTYLADEIERLRAQVALHIGKDPR